MWFNKQKLNKKKKVKMRKEEKCKRFWKGKCAGKKGARISNATFPT